MRYKKAGEYDELDEIIARLYKEKATYSEIMEQTGLRYDQVKYRILRMDVAGKIERNYHHYTPRRLTLEDVYATKQEMKAAKEKRLTLEEVKKYRREVIRRAR